MKRKIYDELVKWKNKSGRMSYGIRLSKKNFGFENDIKSLPLYAAFCI